LQEKRENKGLHGLEFATIRTSYQVILDSSSWRFAVRRATTAILALVAIAFIGSDTGSVAAFQAAPAANGKLIVFGDVTLFLGKPGTPGNCALQSRFKKGDPVGFRAVAIDPV